MADRPRHGPEVLFWEGGHIAMKDAAGADLYYHEYIKDMEASSDRDHEVACQQDLRKGLTLRSKVLWADSPNRFSRFSTLQNCVR